MAEGLTVNGTPFRVRAASWRELPSLYQGGRARMRDNSLVSTEDETTRKRVCECEVYVITDAEEATIRSAAPLGIAVAVAGELVSTGFSALVDIGQVVGKRTKEGGLQVIHRIASVHIEEA